MEQIAKEPKVKFLYIRDPKEYQRVVTVAYSEYYNGHVVYATTVNKVVPCKRSPGKVRVIDTHCKKDARNTAKERLCSIEHRFLVDRKYHSVSLHSYIINNFRQGYETMKRFSTSGYMPKYMTVVYEVFGRIQRKENPSWFAFEEAAFSFVESLLK